MSYVDVHGIGAPLGAAALTQAVQARAAMTPQEKTAEALNRANTNMALLLRPLVPAIQRLPDQPGMMAIFKRDVVHRPIDALLDLFRPVEALAVDIITEANKFANKQERLIGVPGLNQRVAKMAVDQPEDARLDNTMRAFVRRLRIVTNYMILCAYDPVALAVGTAKALVARGIWSVQKLNELLGKLPNPVATAQAAAAAAAEAARAAKNAVSSGTQTAATNASNTVQAAAEGTKRLFGLSGYGGLGDGGLSAGAAVTGAGATEAAGTGGVTAAGATTGAVLTPEMVQLILGLLQIGAPLAAGVAQNVAAGQQPPGPGQPGYAPRPGEPGYTPPADPNSVAGIPLPLLVVGAGLALMALKK